jgi:hypothetical protein
MYPLLINKYIIQSRSDNGLVSGHRAYQYKIQKHDLAGDVQFVTEKGDRRSQGSHTECASQCGPCQAEMCCYILSALNIHVQMYS